MIDVFVIDVQGADQDNAMVGFEYTATGMRFQIKGALAKALNAKITRLHGLLQTKEALPERLSALIAEARRRFSDDCMNDPSEPLEIDDYRAEYLARLIAEGALGQITRLHGLLKEAGEEIDGCKRALHRIADMPFAGREDDACGEDDAYSDGYDKAIDDASTMAKNGLERMSPDLSDRIMGV